MTQDEARAHRCHGAVRREVRRRGSGSSSVGDWAARAVRRHARAALRPARPGQAARRVLDRRRRAPRGGPGRVGRVRVPGARAPLVAPAHRNAQGPARGAARAGRRHARGGCATPRRRSSGCVRRPGPRRRRRRWRRRRPTCSASVSSRTRCRTGPAPTTCAGSCWTSAAGSARSARPSSRRSRGQRRPVVVVAVNDGRASGASAPATSSARRPGPRRRRWRQGRRRAGRRQRPVEGRRSLARGRALRRRAVTAPLTRDQAPPPSTPEDEAGRAAGGRPRQRYGSAWRPATRPGCWPHRSRRSAGPRGCRPARRAGRGARRGRGGRRAADARWRGRAGPAKARARADAG